MSDDKEYLLKELKKLQKKKDRKKPSCCCCSLFFIIIIATLFGMLVIKSGIVKVPFLSNVLYRGIAPVREIIIPKEVKSIQSVVVDFATQTIQLTEQQLTGLVQKYAQDSLDPMLDTASQIAVTAEFIELSGILQKPFKVPFVAQIIPSVSDKGLEFDVSKLQIGAIKVPSFFVDFAVEKFLQNITQEITESFSAIGSFESFDLSEGALRIDTKLAN